MINIYYKYEALNDNGEEISGIVKSKSKEDASRLLMEKDYIPTKIQLEIILRNKITNQELYLYCQKFASLIGAGIDIISSMDILGEESENILLKNASEEIKLNILSGALLSESFENTRMFPNILINMIRVGEETGELDITIKQMSQYFYNKQKLESKVKNTLIYPSILISLTIFITIFLLIFIVPKFNDIFISNDLELPLITKIIIGSSNILRTKPIILIMIPVIIAILMALINLERYRFVLDKFKIKYSVFRKINKKRNILNVLTPLSLMFSSGIPIIDILELVETMVDNSYIESKIDEIKRKVKKGESLSKSFEESNIFTKMINTSIKVGEETGSLDNVLTDLTSFYEEDILNSLDRLILILEPSLIIIIGILIGSITIGLVLPILSLMEGFV